ncbi:MAG TPA: FG-GAP-like repeat-containing protein [Bryobacteraceae bacterium]|nr:FG-GAP-like repeat-containing protein [Bryobacteraceae bacterium]
MLSFAIGGFSQQISFQPPLPSPTKAAPVALATGDFNGDGIPDVAVSDAGVPAIDISLGNGDGTFQAAASYPVAGGCVAGSLTIADFNADHKQDLLAICQAGNQFFVFPGRGDGTLGPAISTQLPFPAFSGTLIAEGVPGLFQPVVADFNGDGKPDLVVLLSADFTRLDSGSPYFLPGRGDGTFGAPAAIAHGVGLTAMVAGDFNGDSKTDLAWLTIVQQQNFGDGDTTGFTQKLAIQLGNGDGTFRSGASYPWTGATFGLAAADMNGDGLIDLVSAGYSLQVFNSGVLNSQIRVMLGDGKGNFQPGFSADDPASDLVAGFCLANLRGKGSVDLLETYAAVDAATVSVSVGIGSRTNDGNGGFGEFSASPAEASTFVFGSACADYNGDGLTDVAYTGIPLGGVAQVLINTTIQSLQQLAQTLAMLPSGSLYVSLNSTPQALMFSNVNAASFATDVLATNSIVTAFWNGPLKPAGIGVNVKDSAGTTRAAKVFFTSASQINYALPDGTATGDATITITGSRNTYTSHAQIVAVAPGVFNAGGLAVGNTLTVHNGKQTPGNLVEADSSGKIEPAPIDVGTGSDQVFLILYGTGLRNHTTPVTATVGKAAATVAYAGAQGTFLDEDQINILLPQSLRGAGLVNVVLDVDGQSTNSVQILIQ